MPQLAQQVALAQQVFLIDPILLALMIALSAAQSGSTMAVPVLVELQAAQAYI